MKNEILKQIISHIGILSLAINVYAQKPNIIVFLVDEMGC